MADEKRKIKIIPESYPHDIGEVEITIDEQEIKDFGFITAYKNTLKTMLKRVKNTNFHTAVGANTDYKKINSVPILWRDDNNKLDYDAREKDLTRWFSESLENKINELSMAETLQIESAKLERQEQMPPITHTPEYIIKLLDAGKIDEKKNCLCGWHSDNSGDCFLLFGYRWGDDNQSRLCQFRNDGKRK